MKRFVFILIFCTLSTLSAVAAQKSQTVVYINGSKYYIHTLVRNETLASIAKEYRVSESILEKHNTNFDELIEGENIKIPYLEQRESESAPISGLRKFFTFNKHKVVKGETLYAISRKYEISIDVIMEDNPQLDPLHLALGQEILIRKKMKGKSSEEQSLEEWEDYRSKLNMIAAQENYRYHIVAKGETIYSLARQVGMSEAAFIDLNNLQSGLKAGSMIKMPIIDEGFMVGPQQQEDEEEVAPKDKVSFGVLASDATIRVAVMLPLTSEGRLNRQFAEFYKGFLMGVDRVKKEQNRSVEITLYDTERSAERVAQIVDGESFEGTNLIVGPIYEDLLEPVLRFAEQQSIPVVSPLASLSKSHSSVLFQMAPLPENRYSKMESLVADTKHITLIYSGATDTEFEKAVLSLLGSRPYAKQDYEYEHPTVVAEKIRDGKESLGDLSNIIANGKDNTVVVMSDNEIDVDRVLSALSSAQANHVARGLTAPKYQVLGNSAWSKFHNIDRTILFKNNVSLISSYHTKRDSQGVKLFDSDYIEEFGSMPSLYAYRGYDAAVIFVEGLYRDMEYDMEGCTYAPLQSKYRFAVDSESGMHINQEWVRVNYNNNYIITLE